MAENISIDQLQIEISASSTEAAKHVKELSDSLKELRKSLPTTTNAKRINEFVSAITNIDDSAYNKLNRLSKAMERLNSLSKVRIPADLGDNLRNTTLSVQYISDDAINRLDSMTRSLQRLANVNLHGMSNALRSVRNSPATDEPTAEPQDAGEDDADVAAVKVARLKKLLLDIAHFKPYKINVDSDDVDKATKKVNKLTKLLESVKRIAIYRAIRSGIKAITDGVNTGVKNLYEWSRIVGTNFKPAMDSIATSALYAKNSLGAMVGPIIEMLAPAIEWLTDKFVTLINVINQFFAVIAGKSTYTKAVRKATEYSKATEKAAKAAKDFLLGIDELNVISNSSGGVGSTAENFTDMFDEDIIPNNAITDFAFHLRDILFDWSGTPESVARKLLTAIFGAAGAIIGWTIGGPLGAAVGLFIGAALSFKIADVIFNGDGKLDEEEILSLIMIGVFGLAGGIIGWALGGPAGAAVGFLVGAGLGFTISQLMFNFDGKLSDEEKLTAIMTAVLGVAGGIIGWTLGGPIGTMVGLTIGAGLGIILKEVVFNNDGEVTLDEILSSAITVLAAIGGGVIGFIAGGPAGAAIGVAVGAGLSLLLTNALFKEDGASYNLLISTLVDVLSMGGLGLIGFAIGGPLGAVIGVTVGAGVSVAVKSALFGENGLDNSALMNSLVTVLAGAAGGAIGFFLGGHAGAALGATIGVALKLLAESVDFSDLWNKAKEWGNNTLDGINKALGINSPSTEFYKVGDYSAQGLNNGFSDVVTVSNTCQSELNKCKLAASDFSTESEAKIKTFATNSNTELTTFKDNVNSHIKENSDFYKEKLNGAQAQTKNATATMTNAYNAMSSSSVSAIGCIIEALNAIPTHITTVHTIITEHEDGDGGSVGAFASGGFPTTGQLFMAREAGPELVGTIGGKTAVANNAEIVAGISQGVASANSEQNVLLREQNELLSAILSKTGVSIDGKTLMTSVERAQRQRGANIMAGGVFA